LGLVGAGLGFRFANKSWIRDWVRVLGVVRTGIRIRDLGLVGVEFGTSGSGINVRDLGLMETGIWVMVMDLGLVGTGIRFRVRNLGLVGVGLGSWY